jgi:hypothetical protein
MSKTDRSTSLIIKQENIYFKLARLRTNTTIRNVHILEKVQTRRSNLLHIKTIQATKNIDDLVETYNNLTNENSDHE